MPPLIQCCLFLIYCALLVLFEIGYEWWCRLLGGAGALRIYQMMHIVCVICLLLLRCSLSFPTRWRTGLWASECLSVSVDSETVQSPSYPPTTTLKCRGCTVPSNPKARRGHTRPHPRGVSSPQSLSVRKPWKLCLSRMDVGQRITTTTHSPYNKVSKSSTRGTTQQIFLHIFFHGRNEGLKRCVWLVSDRDQAGRYCGWYTRAIVRPVWARCAGDQALSEEKLTSSP